MEGQRVIMGPLPEMLDFDHGSSSGNAVLDQQICWNNMQAPVENHSPEFMLSPSQRNNVYVSPVDQERQNLSGWSFGEPTSSGAQNGTSAEMQKSEHGWSSSAGAGPRLEERQYEPTNILSLDSVNRDPQFMQSSNSITTPHNLNLNAGFVVHGNDTSPLGEASNMYKSSRAHSEQISHASGSSTFSHPSGSSDFVLDRNDSRPGSSLDGRRQSRKRKAAEEHIGQSSVGESSSLFQCSESSAWTSASPRHGVGSSLNISGPPEQVNPRLGLGLRGLASDNIPESGVFEHSETSHRNFRLRINTSSQEPGPPGLFSAGNAVRHSHVPSSNRSSRLLPIDHSLEFRSLPGVDSATSHGPVIIPAPALPQNIPPFTWTESSIARIGSSSNSINLPDREEADSRSNMRNLWEHPMFVPAAEFRTSVRNLTNRVVTSDNANVPGNIASTSRTGSSSGANHSSAQTWVSHPNLSSRNSRRLAEFVRQSLFSSGPDAGGQSSQPSPMPLGPPGSSGEAIHSAGVGSSSGEAMRSSGIGNPGHHRSYPRPGSWMDRQGDGVLGLPYPLRTLAANGGGRGRLLVSEHIRNVLDLMRRGENLRYEDVMILDQSILLGVADIHDRHRDMRLDVDNMSYEELLALEERIGNVSTGLSEEIILNRLKQRKNSVAAGTNVEAEPCCVCQEEYNTGEDIGTLDCGHDFHTDCIKQWLMLKNWCPICKTTGLAT